MLRDLTDSLMRVVSGRPSRKNSGELKALKAAVSSEVRGRFKDKEKKAGGAKGRSKTVPKKGRKRNEEDSPAEHSATKRTRTGK